ncbi:Hypothetical protein R9X50_00432200 [Acrodontium crateriforme]|uniref:Myb-like domain-containing protein n=1 Tax=Acrodontium crateriforme TaxID=150365 RepID=A0AAQ3R4Z2_9PEZI|nr:Hypothetical protein R9X50_00432200 [Acrodontium crateriforme]
MARPYQQEYGSFSYGSQSQEQVATDEALQVSTGEYQQQLLASSFHPSHGYTQTPSQEYNQHGVAPMLPSQISAPEPAYGLNQNQVVPSQNPMSRQMSAVSSHYGTPYESPEVIRYPQESVSRKRSHPGDDYGYESYQSLQDLQAHAGHGIPVDIHGQHAHMQQAAYPYQAHDRASSPHGMYMSQQQHHHHRLPNQQPPNKQARFGYEQETEDHGPPSVVGQPGMPEPAARPKGPKLKFTTEDDSLLVELKETKNLTWKQIADFFPGRSSGTLQVRYCTKLKAKTTVWTEDMVTKLLGAIKEYDEDRWRIISGKVGNGFSAAACKEKCAELNGEVLPHDEEDLEGVAPDELPTSAAPSIHDPRDSYQQDAKYPDPREPYHIEPQPYHRDSEGCVVPVSGPMDGNFLRYDSIVGVVG